MFQLLKLFYYVSPFITLIDLKQTKNQQINNSLQKKQQQQQQQWAYFIIVTLVLADKKKANKKYRKPVSKPYPCPLQTPPIKKWV